MDDLMCRESPFGLAIRHASGSVRNRRTAGCRRHGAGLPRGRAFGVGVTGPGGFWEREKRPRNALPGTKNRPNRGKNHGLDRQMRLH